ncbi:MAG: hypothetical protein ABIG95_02535 [Candidatus Woesearchaeota archaeon]
MADANMQYIEAEVQKRLAEFLVCKDKILRLMNHSDVRIKDRAKVLLGVQDYLQVQLTQVLNAIERAKQGTILAEDIVIAASFAYAMEKQIKDVKNLEVDAGVQPAVSSDFLIYGLIAVAGIVLGSVLMKRR